MSKLEKLLQQFESSPEVGSIPAPEPFFKNETKNL